MNAHNGLGSYSLMAGIYRLVCENGMVVAERDFGKIELRHIGFEPKQVIDASKEFIAGAVKLSDKVNEWNDIELTPRSRQDFFIDATRIRFGDSTTDDLVKDVSQVRREADRKNNLWNVFNIAQENIIRGGFRNGATGRMVRPIRNIQKDVNFNTKLWDLASTYSMSN